MYNAHFLTGTYITSADALDTTISEEDIWANNDPERAIALVATRLLFYERAGGLLGPDKELMHGKYSIAHFTVRSAPRLNR